MVDQLTRTTFSTSRLAEFASEKGLTTQTGHSPDQWPQVIVKELADNGIDATEAIGVPPIINITVADNAITVTDNGGGISPKDLARILDYTQRVSSNEAYVGPTRGRQGNALQTVLALPFVMDDSPDKRGETTIESRGILHTVVFEIDAIRQEPKVSTTQRRGGFVHSGTRITVRLPVSASSKLDTAKPQIVQIAEDYATLNPHLTITLKWNGRKEVDIKAAVSAWTKWLPSDPIVAHWYDLERFNRLIGAKISHDQDNNGNTLVREFVADFKGMARSAAQKNVLDKTDTSRTTLATLFNEGHNRADVTALLSTLKAETKPVQPADLGIIGREHLERVCVDAGGNIETFNYSKATGTTDELPWAIEAAFAYCPAADQRRLITGCNWSPGIRNPFRHLDEVLEQQRTDYGIVAIVHLACPVLGFTDRGKSTLALPAEIETAVTAAVVKVTAAWAKQIKTEERNRRAKVHRIERLTRVRRVSKKAAVYEALPAGYAKVSDNGALPANVRQIYYAIRNEVQEKTGKGLDDQYTTQTLIPNYITEHGVNWDVVYDDRGHLVEPHTDKTIGLGTLAVRDYLAERKPPQIMEAALQDAHVETYGAAGNYGALLYVEKEGFDSLINSVNLRDRFDIGIMSCKGMSVVAARSLIDDICSRRGIPLFVLHDFDKSGLSIASTLSRDTRRHQYENAINITDLGIRMDDVDELNLRPFAESHSDRGSAEKRRANMELNGATEEEIEFLLHRRIELNALTSRQFIDLIERKLTEHGVKKIVPGVKLLKDTYRAIVRGEYIREAFEDAIEEAAEEADAITIPATIKDQVEDVLRKNPALRWDGAVAMIARAGLSRR